MTTDTLPATQDNNRLPAAAKASAPRAIVHDDSAFANFLDTARFEHLQRVALMFSQSDMVPAAFRGKPANCTIALQMALRLRVDPYMFLQSCYVVHGKPGIEAKLAIGLANASGVFRGPIRYKAVPDGFAKGCTAYAEMRETGETVEMTVDWKMVAAEKWDKKEGSKWLTMPEIMFRYRAAMFLIRTHCPEVILGLQSKEEVEDQFPQAELVGDVKEARGIESLDELARHLEAKHAPPENTQPEQGAASDAATDEPASGEVRTEASPAPAADWRVDLPVMLALCTGLHQCDQAYVAIEPQLASDDEKNEADALCRARKEAIEAAKPKTTRRGAKPEQTSFT